MTPGAAPFPVTLPVWPVEASGTLYWLKGRLRLISFQAGGDDLGYIQHHLAVGILPASVSITQNGQPTARFGAGGLAPESGWR
jgi:hypothetical protein